MSMVATASHPIESFEISENWHRPVQVGMKRVLDVTVSAMLLVLLLPFFAVLAVLIKLTSSGPLFYRWRVVGKHGHSFTGYKFRSMQADADQQKANLERFNEMRGPVFKMAADPRITSLGRWMRRYSVDELPQLYSVLMGDMSLVGPRPPLISEYAQFTAYQKQKLAVVPGMTCLWQVEGRNSVNDFDEWVSLDLDYIRRWSLWLDVVILARTAVSVFRGTGK